MNWDSLRLGTSLAAREAADHAAAADYRTRVFVRHGEHLLQASECGWRTGPDRGGSAAAFHGMTKTSRRRTRSSSIPRCSARCGRMAGCASTWRQGVNRPARFDHVAGGRRRRKRSLRNRGWPRPGDPSAQAVIKAQCIECHNADGGDMEEIPYAATAASEPEYKLVMVTAKPQITREAWASRRRDQADRARRGWST